VKFAIDPGKRLLDETLSQVFNVADSQNIWIQGQQESITLQPSMPTCRCKDLPQKSHPLERADQSPRTYFSAKADDY